MELSDLSKRYLCQLITGEIQPDTLSLPTDNWTRLIVLAKQEGLAPLLYWRLQTQNGLSSLSDSILRELSGAYYSSFAHNTMLFSELEKILPALIKDRIPVMLLKGAVLSTSLYPQVGLRPMADIDFLVPRGELSKTVKLLQAMGYQEDTHDQTPGLHDMADYHIGFMGGPGKRIHLELHWNLVSSPLAWYAVSVDWFWQHSQVHGIGEGVFQLDPIAHLIYLSAHTMIQHGGSQVLLIWLYDIHLIAQSGLIDWESLIEQASQLRWSGVVAAALRRAQADYNTRLPDGLLERLEQTGNVEVDRLVAFKQSFGGVRLLYDWYSLMALRGKPRLRYALGMIFPQRAYILWRYKPQPVWLWPMYYPYRWLRMLADSCLAIRQGIWRAVK